VDLDPWGPIDSEGLTALRAAAAAFESVGGELVVAVEEPEARASLAGAGLMRAVPPVPGPPEGDADVPLRTGTRPRWDHEFTFPATTRQLRAARRRIAAFAEVAGLDGIDLFELNVAVAEALANAVVHGSPNGADDDVHVRFFCYEDEVAVEVVDGGDGMAATPICAPPDAATSGRGIHFMRALADAVHYTCGPLGTRVLLVKQRS
jgi:stage II sporulation protein AB (anti-sigma F factor)